MFRFIHSLSRCYSTETSNDTRRRMSSSTAANNTITITSNSNSSSNNSMLLNYDPIDLVNRQPLGIPVLRESNLPDDRNEASNFQLLVSAPTDEELHTMWSIWSIFFFMYSVIIMVVFLGIITSKRVRSQPFNHYLIYLMLPDILYTVVCTVQCIVLAITDGHNTPGSCRLQSFYLIFGNGANSWMNAIIAHQIHKLLQISKRGGRYILPTRRWIAIQALVAYVWAGFVAILGILPTSVGIPIVTVPFYGLGCVPVAYDKQSYIFFWLFYYPSFAAIPMTYLIYVTFDIWRKKLIPRTGRRREISLYFGRILVAVYIMWLPALVTIYGFSMGAWPFMYTGLWIHAQGAVSALCSLMKEDIFQAIKNLLFCRCNNDREDDNNKRERSQETPQDSISTLRQPCRERRNNNSRQMSFVVISGLSSRGRHHITDIPENTTTASTDMRLSSTLKIGEGDEILESSSVEEIIFYKDTMESSSSDDEDNNVVDLEKCEKVEEHFKGEADTTGSVFPEEKR